MDMRLSICLWAGAICSWSSWLVMDVWDQVWEFNHTCRQQNPNWHTQLVQWLYSTLCNSASSLAYSCMLIMWGGRGGGLADWSHKRWSGWSHETVIHHHQTTILESRRTWGGGILWGAVHAINFGTSSPGINTCIVLSCNKWYIYHIPRACEKLLKSFCQGYHKEVCSCFFFLNPVQHCSTNV